MYLHLKHIFGKDVRIILWFFLGMLPIVYADTRGHLQIGFVAIMIRNKLLYTSVFWYANDTEKEHQTLEILTPILQTTKGVA